MCGYKVVTMESVVGEADIFVSTTGNFKIIRLEHMKAMKNNAIVGNIGHFDNEIEMEALEKFPGIKVKNNKGYKTDQVYLLPKELDEKVARLHLGALGAE